MTCVTLTNTGVALMVWFDNVGPVATVRRLVRDNGYTEIQSIGSDGFFQN